MAVTADFAELLAHGPSPGITLTDTYESLDYVDVWTNTRIDGAVFSDTKHCHEWGSEHEDFSARTGLNWRLPTDPLFEEWQDEGHWTSHKAGTCDTKRRIYCLEN